jgi:radical SAM protein with 4Fe4S-binding SPASM domain
MELKNKQIIIETTNICDAHCVICPREKFTQKLQAMDMGLFKKIIDDAAQYDLTSVDTCGFGECFLDRNLFERFAYIREKLPKAEIFVSTTGFHMTEDTWYSVFNYIDILKFSIYGFTEKTYEAFHRGKVKYNTAISNILGYLKMTELDAGLRPYTIGLFVTTDLNRHEKDDWVKMWEPKLDEVFVWAPHNWIEGRPYRQVDHSRQATCGRPDNGPLYVHADGTVSPCCWDIHKDIVVGNMTKQSIEEVYHGEPYRKLRAAHRDGRFDEYPCKNCDQTNFNPEVLLYKSNQARQVGQITSNRKTIR